MHGKKIHVEKGQKFGKWTAIREVARDHSGSQVWEFACECGHLVCMRVTNTIARTRAKCRHPQVWAPAGDGTSFIMIGDKRCVVDTADVPLVAKHRWGLHKCSVPERARRNKDNVYVCYFAKSRNKPSIQRLLLADQLTASRPYVDHKNGDVFDNRRSNLRPASHADNSRNADTSRAAPNPYGYRGVFQSPNGKWHARISVDRRRIHLGTFDSPHDAARAYNAAAIKYHGEFARLNDIREDLDLPQEPIGDPIGA